MTEAIGGTAMAAVPGAGSPAQEATDIQINILRGLTSDRAAYYFLAITDAAAFRNALSGFAGDNEYLHNEAERPKLGTTDKSAINVAFTLEGLRLLDVDDNTLVSFPEPFRQGMAARASKLGDTGESAPENWDGRLGSRDIHVVVALNGHDAARFQDDCRKLEEDQNAKGYRVLHAESGGVLLAQDERGSQYRIEHFGFRDGVSQPYVYLGGQRPPPGGGKAQRDASWAPIAPGEFLLGHQDEDNAVQPAPANPSLRRNGTYMVFRKLRQDVAGFRNFLATQRPDLMQRDLLAAQMVGRWRNGTPLVRSPDGPVHTDRDAINDFRYEGEDSDGLRCPLGAHIRRLNPRDTAFRDDANRHRLIRRGIPYGTYLPEEAPDDGAERGLLFVAFNARIDLQFEFLQQQWVNRGEFVGQAGNRKDPIIGANAGTVHDQFIVPGSPAPVFNLPRFVSVRGGDYFYAPGIAALKELAREATSGGPSARFPSIPRQPNRGIAKSPTLFDMDRLREIGLGLLRQQCAPTIAIRQVPLIDSQGALPRAQSIAIVAKRRHVARVLSEDLVYQIAPYAQRIWKISGQRMMIGMASNDPERIKRLAILHAAVAKLGTQRVAELVRDLSAQVIDRIRPRGKFDVVQDFGRVIPIGLAAEYFGVSGPNWVSPTAIAAKFGKKDFGEVPRDWLQTLAPLFEADKPLTTVQFWTRFAFLEIFVNIQRAAELTEIAERSTAELLQHIDSVVADAVALRAIKIGREGDDRHNPEPAITMLDHLVDMSSDPGAFDLTAR